MSNTELIELFKAAEKRHIEYETRFDSGSPTGEYYGRGQLEGMAAALYPFWGQMKQESFSKRFVAYMDVWGYEHSLLKEDFSL
jgi:hypothetical protein